MITIKQGLKLSAIIDKLEIKITDPKVSQEETGADLMMQIVRKAHKAEKEIYNFIATMKNITVEEAENTDLIQFVKDLLSDAGVMDFFKSAAK